MTREDGQETVQASELEIFFFLDFIFLERDGFMSAWLRYNKAAADLKKKAKEREFEKRTVGNLYGGFKIKKSESFVGHF